MNDAARDFVKHMGVVALRSDVHLRTIEKTLSAVDSDRQNQASRIAELEDQSLKLKAEANLSSARAAVSCALSMALRMSVAPQAKELKADLHQLRHYVSAKGKNAVNKTAKSNWRYVDNTLAEFEDIVSHVTCLNVISLDYIYQLYATLSATFEQDVVLTALFGGLAALTTDTCAFSFSSVAELERAMQSYSDNYEPI